MQSSPPESINYADGGGSVIAVAVVFAVLDTVFLVLRFISIRTSRSRFGPEDWIILPAWVLLIGFCVNNILGVQKGGIGRHITYVLYYEPEVFPRWAQTIFVTELLYGTLFPPIKTSILLLYLRLFSINRWFRIATWVLIAYIWAWGAAELLVAIFQCTPVVYQWDKTIEGSCIDILAFYRWISVPNIVHDIAMLLLPLPVVLKLQIDTKQKIAVICVFLTGSIGCVASFVRLSIFFTTDALADNTWVSIKLLSWTLAEPSVVFICSCLPALWPTIKRLTSKKDGSRRGKSHQNKYSSNAGSSFHNAGPNKRAPQLGRNEAEKGFIPLRDMDNGQVAATISASPTLEMDRSAEEGICVTQSVAWTTSGKATDH